jgi:hypothetical protein
MPSRSRGLHGQNTAQVDGFNQLQLCRKAELVIFRFVCLVTEGIIDIQLTNPGDRPAEANQLFAIQFTGPTEVVNNMGDGLSGDRIALIGSRLAVFNVAAVLIF